MKLIHFGIDISDGNIELVALERKHGGTTLSLRGSTEIPVGTMDRGTIFHEDTLATVLKALVGRVFGDEKGKLVAGVSLPESRVYSSMFSFPLDLQGPDLDRAAHAMALDMFPVDLRDMVTDYVVVATDETSQHVLFSAIEESVVRGYAKALTRAGVTPLFFELESAALGRALVPAGTEGPILIADLGTRFSTLAVHDEGGVRMTSSIPVGGNNLTSAIENKLNISYAEAERLKQDFGFDPDANDGRVMLILQSPVMEIVEEIRKTMDFYVRISEKEIRTILLAGGTSLTPNISEYIASNFPGIAVKMGDPFTKASIKKEFDTADFRKKSILFGTATGLALRVLNPRVTGQLNLLPGARRSKKGISAAMDTVRNLTSSLLSMVTRAKRSTPKKKPAKKKGTSKKSKKEEKKALSTAEETVPIPETLKEGEGSDKAVKSGPASEGTPAAEEAGVAAPGIDTMASPAKKEKESTVGDDSVLAQISPALSVMSDDTYSKPGTSESAGESNGSGPGPLTNDQLYQEQLEGTAPAYTADEGDIYRGHTTLERRMKGAEGPAPIRKRGGSPMLTVGLVVLVVILFAAAAVGVYMFVGKGNTAMLPGPIAALFGVGGDDGTLVPVDAGTETASSSVGLTFVAGTTAQETAGGRPFVLTRVLETDVEITGDFEATGIGESTEGKAKGVITVINESGRQYTFVVTTRFLSEDGVLFRLNRRSVIAADGPTDVQVTSDVGGAIGDVAPTDWTIPGLSASLQEVVWGRSTTGMTGGSGTTTIVSVDDLADAKAELEDLLWEEAEANFLVMRTVSEWLHDDLYVWEELSLDAPEEGAELSRFSMVMGLRFRAMVIPQEAIAPLMAERLSEALPEGASDVDYGLGTVSYTIEAYDIATETAVIRAEAPVIKL